jgi:hypothetical protein
MLRTIRLGSCISVQGILISKLPCGRLRISDGKNTFEGFPV